MRALIQFLDERLPLRTPLRAFLSDPQPSSVGWHHTLGSALLFLLIVQFLTGGVLLLFYAPTPDHAWESLRHLEEHNKPGDLVRGIHVWGASFMIVVATLHILRVVFAGAYKRPRELNWMVGMVSFLLILGFAFTGNFLPWDQKGYWATRVGTEMISTGPLLGPFLADFLRGGEEIGAYTLSRFFALHVFFLPGLLVGATLLHLYLLRKHKIARDPLSDGKGERTIPFYPEQMLRDSTASLVVLVLLLVVAILFPPGLEAGADLSDTSYDPRPEWYFLAHYELLRVVPGPPLLATVVLPTLIILALLALPLLDTGPSRNWGHRKLAVFSVVALLAGMYATSAYSKIYHSGERVQISEEALPLPESDNPQQMIRARQVLIHYECVNCHRLRDQGGLVGPDLSQAGWKFSREQLRQQILNPRAGNPDSRMPVFEGKISEEDLAALVEYLSLML